MVINAIEELKSTNKVCHVIGLLSPGGVHSHMQHIIKAAKILGLPYPGGPLIDKYATMGNALAYKFAEPQIPDLNFSFSGVKTSILYFLQKQEPSFIQNNLHDLCASIQHTIVKILLKKQWNKKPIDLNKKCLKNN